MMLWKTVHSAAHSKPLKTFCIFSYSLLHSSWYFVLLCLEVFTQTAMSLVIFMDGATDPHTYSTRPQRLWLSTSSRWCTHNLSTEALTINFVSLMHTQPVYRGFDYQLCLIVLHPHTRIFTKAMNMIFLFTYIYWFIFLTKLVEVKENLWVFMAKKGKGDVARVSLNRAMVNYYNVHVNFYPDLQLTTYWQNVSRKSWYVKTIHSYLDALEPVTVHNLQIDTCISQW